MKIEELFTGNKEEITLRLKPSIKSEVFKIDDLSEVQITYSSDRYWLMYHKDKRIEIDGIGPEDKANMDLVCSEQSIVYVFEKYPHKISLKVKLFNEKIMLLELLEIGYGDIVETDIDKRYSRQIKNNNKVAWLEEQLFVESENGRFALISNSPKEKGFRIFGRKINVDVIREDNKLEIETIVNRRPNHVPNIILAATLKIKDSTSTADIKKETSLVLSQIDNNTRYLHTWRKYQEEEKKITQKKQQDIGFLTIRDLKKIGAGKYRVYYKDNRNSINWINQVLQQDFIELTDNKSFESTKHKVKVLEKKDGYIVISSENGLVDKDGKSMKIKYAFWSTMGDDILQKRRDKALVLLQTNSAPMPQLSAILEGVATSTRERRKIPALTSRVKQEFGSYGPNPMQEEALRIALNTPDIAIIQGPPGTGKTKVISALGKRLAEDAKTNNIDFGKQILLTAFQHDAVDNMVDRTTVMGLPAVKFGKKNSQVDTIAQWIKETIEKVESEQYGIKPNESELLYTDLKQHYLKYIETKDREGAVAYLTNFKELNITSIPIEIANDILKQSKKGEVQNSEVLKSMERIVKNIRSESESYEDDGLFNLSRFLKKYKLFVFEEEIPELSSDELEFLEKLCNIDMPSNDDLERLDEIKLFYLDRLMSGTLVKDISLINLEIENIFLSLLDHYSQEIKRSGSVYSVLSEYIYDLNSNDDSVYSTILLYSTLLASTIQGAKSKKVLDIKPDPFDTVIVDEAARANPLDLIIPMTSAKRRIVLVGDHRQLPHIVDEGIQNELVKDKDIAKEYLSHLKDSLFERLLENAKNLEEKDGIKRVVTLDTQYRMHPILGNFVSKSFYEKIGDPQIMSGTSEENLMHSLTKYKGKVAVSIDIPSKLGEEERYGGSLCRPVEAREVIKVAKEILDEDRTLSVGVITFYRKQVDALYEAAEMENIVERDQENIFKVVKNYEMTIDKDERFRIGTVDAFQGKEFDVVILSLVRSNSRTGIRSKYGFLTSYNRLNVAMSRAKKLLISVGDKDMFLGEDAQKSVYGLYAFYNELIGSEYGADF